MGFTTRKKIDVGPFCALLGSFCRSPRCTSEMAGWQTLQVKSKRFFASVWWWWKHTVKSIRGTADWSSSCQRPSLVSNFGTVYFFRRVFQRTLNIQAERKKMTLLFIFIINAQVGSGFVQSVWRHRRFGLSARTTREIGAAGAVTQTSYLSFFLHKCILGHNLSTRERA